MKTAKDFTPKDGGLVIIHPPQLSPNLPIMFIGVFKEIKDNRLYTYAAVQTSPFADFGADDRIIEENRFNLEHCKISPPDEYTAFLFVSILKDRNRSWDKKTKKVIPDPEYVAAKKKEEKRAKDCNRMFEE